jgi:cellulose synthase (UDP-forming)
VCVWLLDDGRSDAMRRLAARSGAEYLSRDRREGAKAGNINHALRHADAPYVVVLDCDHVPAPHFLEATLGELEDERVAFVQTPQYYANADRGEVPAAAWSQQALFFGPIARGKAGHEAMFCCGTNVVFRREALLDAGGFPADSVTEDFELSIRLHERGWGSRYVPEVLAAGLGPEDMASYVSQQQRWSRGCLGALGAVLRARLPLRLKAQYALSASYFLSGWTVLVYMSFPVVRILTGAQPLAATTADQFLVHFAPYFGMALLALTWLGGGTYTFRAFALQAASFWIHVQSTVLALLGRRGRFVVTPKEGAVGRQPRAVAPALAALAVLVGVAAYGLVRDQEPATLNNVAFAALHVCVLLTGVLPALRATPLAVREPEAVPA